MKLFRPAKLNSQSAFTTPKTRRLGFGRGDQEREGLPDAEQQTARQQGRAETDTAGDGLYGLRACVEPSRQEVGVEGPVRWVVDVVADEEREHRDRGYRRRSAEREDGEPRARERRTRNHKGQPTTVRRCRQPIRERTRGKRDDERKCSFSADQRAYGGRRMDQMDQDHRPVRREHGDCEGEAEGRQAQQHQQRSDLRGRLSSTRKVELPPLRVTLVTVRQALDERLCEVEPTHARAAAAAVATSRG